MSSHSITEAQDLLPDLIERALKGEGVIITRDGHPIVELKPVRNAPEPRALTDADLDWLKSRRVGRNLPKEDAGTFVSRMRDEDWK